MILSQTATSTRDWSSLDHKLTFIVSTGANKSPYMLPFLTMMKRETFPIAKICVPAKRRLTIDQKRVVDSYVARV